MTERIKLVTSGYGKTGSVFVEKALADPEVALVGVLENETHPLVGDWLQGAGKIPITSNLKIINKADVVVEFSTKDAVFEHADHILKTWPRPSWLICTTGIEEDPKAIDAIQKVAERTFVMIAPNATLGMNVMFIFVPLMLKVLAPAGWRAVGHEIHHERKDHTKASGTAVALDKRAQKVAGVGIPFTWSRLLDVTGDHEVTIISPTGEKLKVEHSAKDRGDFGAGALAISKQIVGLQPGLIHSADWLARQLGL